MHHHCLSCSADLGRNESVEAFPLGRRLAFDAGKGRLWVVCPKCRRWNLTPIEERWEPVEALERLFRDSRLRVESENIGLARLPDGTTLVRIGQALPGELAAWRYGDELRRRRWKAILGLGSMVGVALGVVLAGPAGLAAVGIPAGAANLLVQGAAWTANVRKRRRPIYQLDAAASPTGEKLLLRQLHLDGAVLSRTDDGSPTLWLPSALDSDSRRGLMRNVVPQPLGPRELLHTRPLVLAGEKVGRVLGRGMVAANEFGGSARQVAQALARLEDAGGADAFVRQLAARDVGLRLQNASQLNAWRGYRMPFWGDRRAVASLPDPIRKQLAGGAPAVTRVDALALEMALHEEKERRALEGELARLEDEWREAELLARIADALPDEPPAALAEEHGR